MYKRDPAMNPERQGIYATSQADWKKSPSIKQMCFGLDLLVDKDQISLR